MSSSTLYAQKDSGSFEYRKPLFDFEPDKSFFAPKPVQSDNRFRKLRYIAFSGYREGVMPVSRQFGFNRGVKIDKEAGTHYFYIHNTSIVEMITEGWKSTIYLDVKDPSKYRYDPAYGDKLEWMRKNTFCVERFYPLGLFNGTKELTDEIARHFKIEYKKGRQKVKALVLVRTSQNDKLKSHGGQSSWKPETGSGTNISLGLLSDIMPLPFVDETGYSGKVDLELHIHSWSDIPALRKALQKYDLDIKEEMREMDVLHIKEIQ